MNPVLRALNRFGLGARLGEPARLGDPRGWLEAQIEGGPALLSDPAPAERRALLEMLGRMGGREALRSAEGRVKLRASVNPIMAAEARAALEARVVSDRPFVERLVTFWSNHLCVSTISAAPVAPLAGLYEREAVRPHVLGRFEELVLASARHPAMLFYLDNANSIGPTSTAAAPGRRRGRVRGLNENYARELLELHTLGVDGGYTQDDVTELARVLTGWSVGLSAAGEPGARRSRQDLVLGRAPFTFFADRHVPGVRTILGKRYPQTGMAQGEAVIHDLCAHPATARFVATKLVRHFVADEPPARAVDEVSAEFTRSGGDLRRVAGVLIELPEAWEERNRKLRTPQDWLTASLRALGADQVGSSRAALSALRQPLWAPPAPNGWGDTRAVWADPDSLMNRAELARSMANRARQAVAQMEPAALKELVQVESTDPLHGLLSDSSIARGERVALALASPAFQWR